MAIAGTMIVCAGPARPARRRSWVARGKGAVLWSGLRRHYEARHTLGGASHHLALARLLRARSAQHRAASSQRAPRGRRRQAVAWAPRAQTPAPEPEPWAAFYNLSLSDCAGNTAHKTRVPQARTGRHEMDQRPNDRIPPRQDDPLREEGSERPPRTGWDRVTRTEEGAWNYIPLLLVAALIAIGGWLLMAADRGGTPTPKTTENVPNATAPARPTPNTNAAPPATAPAPTPAPATKP